MDDLLDDEDVAERETVAPGAEERLVRKLEKQTKAQLAELEELRAFKAEREQVDRQRAITTAFTEMGLNPKHAEFYQGEDATPEAIKAWAVEKDFLVPDDLESPEPPPPGYTPTVIAEPRALGSRMYTVAEWKQIATTDPARAQRIHEQGQVDLASLRNGLGPDR